MSLLAFKFERVVCDICVALLDRSTLGLCLQLPTPMHLQPVLREAHISQRPLAAGCLDFQKSAWLTKDCAPISQGAGVGVGSSGLHSTGLSQAGGRNVCNTRPPHPLPQGTLWVSLR